MSLKEKEFLHFWREESMPHHTEGFGQEAEAGVRRKLKSEPLFHRKGKAG